MPPLTKAPPWKDVAGPVRAAPGGTGPAGEPTIVRPSGGGGTAPVAEAPSLPTGILPVEFSRLNVAASLTTSQMYRVLADGSATAGAQISFVTPFKGSIVAITISTTTAVTAGTMTITAFRQGSTTTAALPITSGTSARGSWSKGTIPFAAGDTLDLRVTTDSGFLPITLDVEAFVYLTQEVD